MIQTEKDLLYIIEKGQSGIYDINASLIRKVAGDIRKIIELKNPLDGEILIHEINKYIQIINPVFLHEKQWFKEAQKALNMWIKDIVVSNRLLGIQNDNTYDTTLFEKAIMEKFWLSKKPKPDTIIEISFQTMVELVELGARRFK